MDILILHRIPYHKIQYHLGIDHEKHNVTYVGTPSQLANLPEDLRAARLARPGLADAASETLSLLAEHAKRFDRVISLSEYELMDAARIRQALNIPGPSESEVLVVRDKLIMKRLVAAAGIRVPEAMPLSSLLARRQASWAGPTVLKPVDGASSEDVQIFPFVQAMLAALRNRLSGIRKLDEEQESHADRFEAEAFIAGPILHLDGLIRDGRIVALLGSRYVGTCLGFAQGEPLGSAQFLLSDAQTQWAQTVTQAIGLRSGAFHLEVIDDGGEWVFLEIANRVGGADVVDTFQLTTGLHLPSAELALACGEPLPAPASPAQPVFHGWFVFPGHRLPDGPFQLTGHQPFLDSPLLLRHSLLAPDAPRPGHPSYQAFESPFAGIISGSSHQALQTWLESLFASVQLSTSVSPEEAACR
ncbi:hypothetical protein [Chromobacterium sp. IIBBL 290-4]|uniref:hypothetical protein n=1 Tax=Chromobacterium sp. IIBBL 290-4 TaxID=2953890 RepID=UPI0020B68BC5|nr:hypothetical protein [Chromobacterium sp. IIBBL 290-4]UTH76525.1 hypothetical protein NKT35_10675 [Chromobacterium sp. IIBBL 290-4]